MSMLAKVCEPQLFEAKLTRSRCGWRQDQHPPSHNERQSAGCTWQRWPESQGLWECHFVSGARECCRWAEPLWRESSLWELGEDHAVVKSWYHEVYKSLYNICNDFRSWLDFVGVRWTIYSTTWWTFTNYELPFDYSDSLVLYVLLFPQNRMLIFLLLALFDSFQKYNAFLPISAHLASQVSSDTNYTVQNHKYTFWNKFILFNYTNPPELDTSFSRNSARHRSLSRDY